MPFTATIAPGLAPRPRALAGLLLGGLVSFGCAAAARGSAKAATPAAVHGAVEAIHARDNRAKIASTLEAPELRRAASDLTASVVGGAVDALADERRVERLADSSEAFATRFARDLAASWERELSPKIASGVGSVVDSSVARVLNEETEARLAAM